MKSQGYHKEVKTGKCPKCGKQYIEIRRTANGAYYLHSKKGFEFNGCMVNNTKA